mmetsp:Transcript_3414/g.7433  ORF Transcript_3414/g.7433 Transcript_3414/m.7433 type:complete len:224 (-) Transcript_3414:1253-1924(-)
MHDPACAPTLSNAGRVHSPDRQTLLIVSTFLSTLFSTLTKPLHTTRLSLPPQLHQLLHHTGVSQCGGVPQLILLLASNLAQHTPHDLAGAGLGQPRSPVDDVGCCERADGVPDTADQLLAQLVAVLHPLHQGHVRVDALALDWVVVAHHRCLRTCRVSHQRALHLGSTDAVPRHVDHVIYTPSDPKVAIRISSAAVTCEIVAGEGPEVVLLVPLVVTVHCSQG